MENVRNFVLFNQAPVERKPFEDATVIKKLKEAGGFVIGRH